MGELEISQGANGHIEVYGASAKINDQLVANFHERGQMVSRLVIATLTESPYTPVIDGQEFGVEVSNVYKGYGDDDAPAKDTVIEAKEALAEFLQADVPGSRRIGLDSYRTRYGKLLGSVLPGLRTTKPHRDAFDEALVESTRARGVELASPAQALEIVKRAPKTISLFRLSNPYCQHLRKWEYGEAVTENGRIVTVGKREYTLGVFTYAMPQEIHRRGGIAPIPGIVRDIERRVLDLRTGHTKRQQG